MRISKMKQNIKTLCTELYLLDTSRSEAFMQLLFNNKALHYYSQFLCVVQWGSMDS